MSEQDNLQPVDGNEEQKPIAETSELTPQIETTSAPLEDAKNEDVVFEEIEASNAEDAEDEGSNERHTIPVKEYDTMSLEALVIELEKLVSEEKAQAIKDHVDGIKNEFNSKFNTLIDEKKEDFLNEGGNEIDFYFSSPVQKRFKDAYKDYKGKLHSHYKNIETNLKGNLENRLRIIEEIKGLINVEENINTTYKHFKDLQDQWGSAGPIPRDKYNNAWNSYHHHVEIFYDFLHLNRDLRDLDFKHNLDLKIKIIERAEELSQDDDTNRSFRELQVLHKMWKEELGPVSKEHREEIWNRFKAATKIIHNKRQAYYDVLDKVYEVNLEKKSEIIQKIEAITNEGAKSHNGWQAKIKEVEQLRESFFSAGKVPIKLNESTWSKFKETVRAFNRKKNVFYKDLKKEQFDNLQKKLDLIKIAEDHKDSEDTDATTPIMKRIQNDWKKIGHVPRKDSDKIWKQFKAACNAYFDKIHSKKNAENEVEAAAFKAKSELLDTLKTLEFTDEKESDLELIKTQISAWKSIGRVPANKRFIEGKFNKTLDDLFKQAKVSKNEAELIKFENKLDELSNAEDSRHLDNERLFIRKKIDELKGEINQLENNLQFFTNVKDDNPLVKEVHANITRHKDALKLWKTKLSKIKALY
ncbi:DUF349 domain-containing protein [Formosa sp. PL04]|uniref:DUF349 domain-containing protein n=1 Tax=Formosa sp. PL04 TaxID=3081755 RepID=UPI002980A40C|nr:DUF349 domain-containing protein [Formosa sp. PL04]MDW5288800.1 DUF349 domain-containing protein [Formosa sp. PL04]